MQTRTESNWFNLQTQLAGTLLPAEYLCAAAAAGLQCQAEVRRLEGVQLQQMLDLINGRAEELRALCADSHVAEPPGLAEALAAVNSGSRNPGAAADLLAKLFAMLGEVKVRRLEGESSGSEFVGGWG
jgi:hypothetical protein